MPDYTVQRFRGGYALVWTEDGKRRRYQLEATDRASAEAEARKRWLPAGAGDDTVGGIVMTYLRDKEEEGIPSLQRRKDAWKAMCPFWENVDPGVIDEKMCRAYRDSRSVSDATAIYELKLLSTALGHVMGKAKPQIWFPPTPERKERHLTVTEFRRFLSEVRAPHARLYMLLAVFTMARPSAILQLKWSQVDLERGLITLNPVGRRQTVKKRPVVPINDMLSTELAHAYAGRDSEYVVSWGGRAVAGIKKAFAGASERSGVFVTPYMLRHTGAVWAAEQGVPMSELAQMMGHDDDRTTSKYYARYSPQYLKKVASAVQDAFLEVQDEPSETVLTGA